MRINKYIAQSGICSRRRADELIKNGNVTINGRRPNSIGDDVGEGDIVRLNGEIVNLEDRRVYFAFSKPVGVITAMKDARGRDSVGDFFIDLPERVFPVGRLDYDTSGLIIMTNDGDFANNIMHPRSEIKKAYLARVSGKVGKMEISKLRKGVDIGGFVTSRAEAEILNHMRDGTTNVRIVIHEGKNRQVRRMFESVGCNVVELKREMIGPVHIGHLAEGGYRKLTKIELEQFDKLFRK